MSISAGDMTAGLDAARANLRLADELNKDDLPRSRAYWMLGAQLLAHRRFGGSLAAFGEAARYAGTAGAPGEELLSAGFQIMAAQLGGLERPPGCPPWRPSKRRWPILKTGRCSPGRSTPRYGPSAQRNHNAGRVCAIQGNRIKKMDKG